MLIYCSKPGALGNQLILFSHLVAFAEEYNQFLLFPSFDKYYPYFEGTFNNFFLSYPNKCNFSPKMASVQYFVMYYIARLINRLNIKRMPIQTIYLDWNDKLDLCSGDFIQITKKYKVIFLQGWNLRCSQLVEKHQELIRRFFSIRPLYLHSIASKINEWKQNDRFIIGVHMRRGDYKFFENGRYYYDWAVYVRWIQYLKDNNFFTNNVFFYLCSDEQIPLHHFEKFGNNIYISNHSFIDDLYALSNCDFIIGPPSTFSIWASFYGKVPLYMCHTENDLPRNLSEFIIQKI